MNKRRHILLTAVLIVMLALPSSAQIFTMENESNMREDDAEEFGMIPLNGSLIDQANEPVTPIGEGWLLLAALGGAYLSMNKSRKNNKY